MNQDDISFIGWLNTDKKPGVIKQEVIVKAEPRDYDDNDHRGDDNHHRDKGDGDCKRLLYDIEQSHLLNAQRNVSPGL